jgi:hypothetical protein
MSRHPPQRTGGASAPPSLAAILSNMDILHIGRAGNA